MDYSQYLAGSPLIPPKLVAIYIFGLIVFLGFTYLFLCQKKTCRQIKKRLAIILKIALVTQFFFLLSASAIATYLLLPKPEITQVLTNDKITIIFSRPVSRQLLEKSIEPEVPGVWLFEDSLYATHLYRHLVFYPDDGFEANTEYTINLKNISNTSKLTDSYNYEFKFTSDSQSFPIRLAAAPTKVKLNVPIYLQQHPLSCEASTLRMALAYRNIQVSEDKLLAEVGFDPTPHQGRVWGNPYQAFVGDVNGRQMTTGYGVYWGPIAKVARNYRNATEFTNWNISKLTAEIDAGNPVIIWGYSRNGTPTYWNTPQGERIHAVAGEHTVVVAGYVGPATNPTQIIVNDPLIGQVYWSRATFDKKWASFSQSGVVVY